MKKDFDTKDEKWKIILQARNIVLEILDTFPRSKNWSPYLVLKNKKKVFFRIFVKKYGIDGSQTKYTDSDVIRRIRVFEFLGHIMKTVDVVEDSHDIIICKSKFYTLIFKNILHVSKWSRWELLSVYPHI